MTLDSVDPTRLSVSEDGRTVYLDGEEFLDVCTRLKGPQTFPKARILANLPYMQYALNALAAHGSDFSYLRHDCEMPFPGRVMAAAGESRPGTVLSVDPYGQCVVQFGFDRPFHIHRECLRPLPLPKERRPMTPGCLFILAEQSEFVFTDDESRKWVLESMQRMGSCRLRRGDAMVIKTPAELAAENWTCGDQLLSVAEGAERV